MCRQSSQPATAAAACLEFEAKPSPTCSTGLGSCGQGTSRIRTNIGWEDDDIADNPQHTNSAFRDADCVLANPTFNLVNCLHMRQEPSLRGWKLGNLPNGNANFTWNRKAIHAIEPKDLVGAASVNLGMSHRQSGASDLAQQASDLMVAKILGCLVAFVGQYPSNNLPPPTSAQWPQRC